AHDIDRAHPDVIVVAFDEDIEPALSELGGLLASARIPVVAVIANKAESAWAAELVRAGVRAVLPLDVGSEELHAAIAAAAKNLVSLDADFLPALFSRAASVRGVDGNASHLTARERDVLQMMADGLANKAIAQRIGISTHTVKFHVGSIMSKLNATSRTEAVTLGIRRGLILL
ncbi:MAG TPA: response regulator transcription factor, partial [Candidatus Eremiobacteraceae bacterium]|nr:response regulator transcription factor [Candidatus Eremiobacteraceae bacterium]